MILPWLPEGRTTILPGRGEVFFRIFRHADPAAPTVLLLHGWTASADLQFFTAYEALARQCSFVAIDHRGHGRGMRASERFELEAAADDAAALVEQLGLGPVITVGYSMGGPVSMLLARRHPQLVGGIVVAATALEWRATLVERARWKTVRMLGPVVRSWAFPSWLRTGLRRMSVQQPQLAPYIEWLSGEIGRNNGLDLVYAGQALSRYDARPWARALVDESGLPTAMLITTRDRLVRPSKQRRLADALRAHVIELHGDHLAAWMNPDDFARLIVELIAHVHARVQSASSSAFVDETSSSSSL